MSVKQSPVAQDFVCSDMVGSFGSAIKGTKEIGLLHVQNPFYFLLLRWNFCQASEFRPNCVFNFLKRGLICQGDEHEEKCRLFVG